MKLNRSRKLLALGALIAVLAVGGAVSIAAASSGDSGSSGTNAGANASTGTVALRVTGPKGNTRPGRTRPVRCSVNNGTYVLQVGRRRGAGPVVGSTRRARRVGHGARVTLTVPSYHGAGSYTGTLHLSAHVLLTRLQRSITVPVTLTSTGGSLTVKRTLPGTVDPQLRGKTVSATAAWSCTP